MVSATPRGLSGALIGFPASRSCWVNANRECPLLETRPWNNGTATDFNDVVKFEIKETRPLFDLEKIGNIFNFLDVQPDLLGEFWRETS